MARGFLGGVVTGGVVVLGVAATVSLLAPLPRAPEVTVSAGDALPLQDAPDAPSLTTGSSEEVGDVARSDADRTRRVTTYTVPITTEPDADSIVALDAAALSPASPPETGGADTLDGPLATPEGNGAAPTADEPVLPNPMALAPMEPQDADELSISTEPAQPPAPAAEAVESAFASAEDSSASPAQPDIAQVSDGVEQVPAAPPSGAFDDPAQPLALTDVQTAGNLPRAGEAEVALAPADAPVVPTAAAPDDAPAAQPDPVARPIARPVPEEESPAVGERPAIVEAAPEVVVGETAATDTAPDVGALAPDTPQLAEASDNLPRIGTPATSLADRETGVTINRLPTLGEDESDTPSEPETPAAEPPADPRPIARYAVDYTPEPEKPIMSIVLIDDGQSLTGGQAGLAALRSFPYPVTFAVDATLEDAQTRMRAFRDEGFEVLAMVDLPEGADARDAETTFGSALARVPEAVGVLEGISGGFQGSRATSDQVAEILADTGHGLVTQDKGLNTMPKLARKQGVPARPIFRDFDSKGQSPTVIRRFLDGAAFKARQEGGVIMLGRLRPDTISALLLWGLQDRASKVSLAPVSAVLQQE